MTTDVAGEAVADTVLAEAWRAYLETYVQPDGRVVDPGAEGRSTSEGQAYALARAVIVGDAHTFERVRAWTEANLQHGDPAALPAWLWGPRADGTWGVQDEAPASDADQWMAWALLRAARRFGEPRYHEQALALLARTWDEETAVLGVGRVLLPGPWARGREVVQLNPSYWLTFAWREFAAADPAHDWAGLLDPAYLLLEACRTDVGVAQDWCHVSAADSTVHAAPRGSEAHDDFGFEAFRVAWTLAADADWYGDRRARRLLRGYDGLAKRWRRDGALPGVLAPDGRGRVDWPYQGQLGALLPAWGLTRPSAADALWRDTLAPTRAGHGWGDPADYYGQNWIWLGYALWSGQVGRPS